MQNDFTIALSEDGRTVVVGFEDDVGDTFTKSFDADSLQDFVRSLALLRARMNEPVPADLEPQFQIDTIEGPAWRIPDGIVGRTGKMIVLRHPGYGWLAFRLTAEQLRMFTPALSK